MARVVWSTPARRRLTEILEYLSEHSPSAASAAYASITRGIFRLVQWPHSSPWVGALYPELIELDDTYRVLVVRPYLVFYRVRNDEVRVLTVRHGAQLPPSIEALEG